MLLLFHEHFHRVLRFPLEGREGLRDKAGRADCNANALSLWPVFRIVIHIDHLLPKPRDSFNILHALSRKAYHKIKLHRRPAARKGDGAGVEQLLFLHVFVDCVAQALCSGLRRKGEPAFTHGFELGQDFIGKTVYTQRRKRKAYVFVVRPLCELLQERRYL